MNNEMPTRKPNQDDKRKSQLANVALAAVVIASALAVVPGTAAAQANQTFIVEQGSQCVQVTPLGNGTQSVEEFYDYQVLNDTANYSSLGTTDIQMDQTSQMFVYRESEGLSLVFLNDKIGPPGGYVATADISGLPTDGQWVVEDDNYTNRDDTFEYNNTGAHIEWSSNGERTDGAAFRGLESPNYSTVTVDIKFNEETNRYPFDEWSGSSEQNEIESWIARSGTGETAELDMNQPIEISPGTCSGGVSTFTAIPGDAGTAETGTTGTKTTSPTATPTQTATTTRTATPAATAIQTVTPAATPTAATTSLSADGTTNSTGDSGGTTEQTGGDRGGSGAFGPGFGIGLALVAVLILAAVALAYRSD